MEISQVSFRSTAVRCVTLLSITLAFLINAGLHKLKRSYSQIPFSQNALSLSPAFLEYRR